MRKNVLKLENVEFKRRGGEALHFEFSFQNSTFLGQEAEAVRHWRDVAAELHGVCEEAFQLIHRSLRFDQADLFLFDEEARALRSVKVMSGGELLDGEEEIPLAAGSILKRLVSWRTDWLELGAPDHAAFLPLGMFGRLQGALRLRRSRESFSDIEKRFLRGLAQSLSLALWRINLAVEHRLRENQLRTYNEVSVLVHQSLRLRELLEDVAKRLVKNQGFDRVKIYRLDPKRRVLRGEAAYTGFEGPSDITGEAIKMGTDTAQHLPSVGKWVNGVRPLHRSVPLRARQEVMGVLMVDNLLSQQEITPDEVQLLETLANQLGLAVKNASLYEGVEELALTDELTRLYLARYFKERLEQECLRTARAGHPFAVCMIDVDHFKRINDTYGHPVGDRVLQGIARQLQAASRKVDVVARYAGDEFVILLPNTGPEQALRFAQRLRQSVARLSVTVPGGAAVKAGISIGVSVSPDHGVQADELMRCADQALYMSKRAGRNEARLFSRESQAAV